MAEKVEIPLETKYKFAVGGYHSVLKGFMHAIREEYGAAAALKLYEKMSKEGDRVKNFANAITTVFKLEGNDAETIAKWQSIFSELTGIEYTWLERSKTLARVKVTKCPWKTEGKDISDWPLIFLGISHKTINPKATIERPKGMCAGDPYCEYIYKIEE